MKKISKQTKKYLDENPSGKIEDLPKEMKDVFDNIFNRTMVILEDKNKD